VSARRLSKAERELLERRRVGWKLVQLGRTESPRPSCEMIKAIDEWVDIDTTVKVREPKRTKGKR
jgi:hypothetical protein